MSDTSRSNRPSFRWLFARDYDRDVGEAQGIWQVRSSTLRHPGANVGQHRIRYRHLDGERVRIESTSVVDNARYVVVPASDKLASNHKTWRHFGDTLLNSKRWAQGLSGYVRWNNDVPTIELTVKYFGEDPVSLPETRHYTIFVQ